MITLVAILLPSFLCIYITIWGCKNFMDLDLTARYVLTGIYSLSLFLCLWAFFMVSFSEPGIMPSVFMNTKIQNIEVKKINVHKEYYVEYKNRQELNDTMEKLKLNNPVDKYYNLNKFKYLPANESADRAGRGNMFEHGFIEPRKRHNKMSYCHTCQHLRPPRSFHCSQCGVCVEVHDHHCPWVGTCIGYRNVKYFIAFLFWTGLHALITCCICIMIFFIAADQLNGEKNPNATF